MSNWDTWIDKLIREAQERGQFDNLPGKGRPLNLDDDEFVEPDWRLANRLLKNGGFAPDWIEADREVRDALAAARQALVRTRDWRDGQLAALGERRDPGAERERDLVEGEWRRAGSAFLEAGQTINRKIAMLNLKVPVVRLQQMPIDAAAELRHLESLAGPDSREPQ